MRRIGVLMAHAESDPEFKAYVAAFRAGLEKLGWTVDCRSELLFVGGHPTTWRQGSDPQKN